MASVHCRKCGGDHFTMHHNRYVTTIPSLAAPTATTTTTTMRKESKQQILLANRSKAWAEKKWPLNNHTWSWSHDHVGYHPSSSSSSLYDRCGESITDDMSSEMKPTLMDVFNNGYGGMEMAIIQFIIDYLRAPNWLTTISPEVVGVTFMSS
jgi:hypothetical protein